VPWRCHSSLVDEAISVSGVPVSRFYRRAATDAQAHTCSPEVGELAEITILRASDIAVAFRQARALVERPTGRPSHQRLVRWPRDPRHGGIADLERDCGHRHDEA